jgi:glycosyltransferase involved in cell wall biosynthesis
MPTRKIKVLTLVDGVGSGGAETLAARIATGLDPTRFERFVCVTRPTDRAAVGEVAAAGPAMLALERTSRWAVWQWWPLIRLLRRERVDVLHAHKFGSNVWGAVLGSIARVPVIIAHEHGSEATTRPFRRFVERDVIGRGADLVVAVSEADRRRLVDDGVSADKVRVIPNAVPPLVPRGSDVRAELRIPPDAPVVVTVAVIRPEKALGNLVRAAGAIAREFPGLRVLVAGIGPTKTVEELERLVRELHLDEIVTLLGMRDDVPDLLEAADVAVICSVREGQPLALMEYMAAGKAIVATRVGGVPELVDDGVEAILVAPGDVDALARAIRELLRHPARRAELGDRARERQQAELDLGGMVRRLEDLYEDLASRARRRETPVRRW